jgi:hypothetical protein
VTCSQVPSIPIALAAPPGCCTPSFGTIINTEPYGTYRTKAVDLSSYVGSSAGCVEIDVIITFTTNVVTPGYSDDARVSLIAGTGWAEQSGFPAYFEFGNCVPAACQSATVSRLPSNPGSCYINGAVGALLVTGSQTIRACKTAGAVSIFGRLEGYGYGSAETRTLTVVINAIRFYANCTAPLPIP